MTTRLSRRDLLGILVDADSLNMQEHVLVNYRISLPPRSDLDETAARLALITSIGTSIPLAYEDKRLRMECTAKVTATSSNADNHFVSIAYPLALCQPNLGLTQALSTACYASEYDLVSALWIEDIHFPKKFLNECAGPRLGINQIRHSLQVAGRPLLGVIIKPRAGASLSDISRNIFEALAGGADYVIDDELITNPHGQLSFETRAGTIAETTQRAATASGEKKWYIANVTASPLRALELAFKARTLGANGILINAFVMGFPALEDLAKNSTLTLPIITSNMGTAMLARSHNSTGISEVALAKLSRIAGADGVYSGILSSSWYNSELFRRSIVALRGSMHNIAPSFPVVAGGLNAANVLDNVAEHDIDILLQAGTSILGHPLGARAGAEAIRNVMNIDSRLPRQEADRELVKLGRHNEVVRLALQAAGFTPRT